MSESISILKTCRKCNIPKASSEFRKQSSNRDGLKNVCKSCDDLVAKSYYEKNKETRIKQILEWNSKNIEKTKTYKQNYRNKL